jgi:fructose-bisphosphate aldolase class 1
MLADELIKTAKYLATPGKGILASDESTGTIGKRLASINLENVESNRQALRELLFTTPGLSGYLSGVILFEETLYQKTSDGKPFVDVLTAGGLVPGIKVDKASSRSPAPTARPPPRDTTPWARAAPSTTRPARASPSGAPCSRSAPAASRPSSPSG